MEVIRRFSGEQYAAALGSWEWLGLAGKAVLCASPFGDVFLEDPDGVWWLDVVDGALTRPWPSRAEFAAAMATVDGQSEYLLAALALAAEEAGLVPGPDDVYAFAVPPKLGGAFEVDNVEIRDFVVSLTIAGQIHRQIGGDDLDPVEP